VSRIHKSKYKVSRRLGTTIWGEERDAYNKRNYKPGQHGASGMVRSTDYGIHLKAKQRLKAHYGRINERQFRNIFIRAQKMQGNKEENFIGLLESRLDVIVYRLNLAPTIFAARQLVSHKHVMIDGKVANIPSLQVKPGSFVELTDVARQIPLCIDSVNKLVRKVPSYLELDASSFKGKFLRRPQANDVPYPFDPEAHLLVEFYSR
jgi:small subunit ribosomal protein S4